MKIAVLGGGGFIGSTISDRLLRDGHRIKIFDRPGVEPYRSFAASEQVEWITGDLADPRDVDRAIGDVEIVLHLISTTLPKESNRDPIYDLRSNVIATLQVLDAMIEHQVGKIVFISSGGTVYGCSTYLPMDEKHPTNPLVSYGITKLTIEKYLRMYRHLHGIQAVTLRVANAYGERQPMGAEQGAVGIFLWRALKGLPIDIWGDGRVTRDYIHARDIAEAFVRAIAYSGTEVCFNIGSGTGTSLNELLDLLEDVLDRSIVRRYLGARPFDVPVNILDNTLARQELGWQPQILLKEGLVETAAWMKNVFDRRR